MPPATMPSRDALHRLLDGLQTLIREHLALARVELKQDLRTMGRDLATGAAGLPALATGYLLFMFALASLISLWLPAWAAFGLVALLNLAAGGAITWSASRRVARDRVELPCTSEEIRRDRERMPELRHEARDTTANARGAARLSQPGSRPDCPGGAMPENPRDSEAIRAGIERARQDIEQAVKALRANVSDSLKWRSFVRRHPGASFAAAMIAGLLIARATTR